MKKSLYILCVCLLFTSCCAPFIPLYRGDCAERALLMCNDLREKGYESRIAIGFNEDYSTAHAWVEYRLDESSDWVSAMNLTEKRVGHARSKRN